MLRVTTCVSRDKDLIVSEFGTREEWVAWINENHPDMPATFHRKWTGLVATDNDDDLTDPKHEQFGTGYRWSYAERIE